MFLRCCIKQGNSPALEEEGLEMKKQTTAMATGRPPHTKANNGPPSTTKTDPHTPKHTDKTIKLSVRDESTVVKSSPLAKSYISKSYENLSSFQRRNKGVLTPRPKSGLPVTSKIDTGLKGKSKDKDLSNGSGFIKPKSGKQLTNVGQMRKASSTQSMDKAGLSILRNSKSHSIKRAISNQHIDKSKFSRTNRTSAPADVMAYNAGLLENFEKEKKGFEARISELVQLAECRKAEIEKHKIEAKHLKERIPSEDLREEVEVLRNENRLLQDRLGELGYHVEQVTDTQKLSMLQSSAENSPRTGGDASSIPQSISFDNLSTKCVRGSIIGSTTQGDGMERSDSLAASEPGLSLADLCSGSGDHNWDKLSNKSSDTMSEIALASLTERILEMQETNYCTNEELQATMLELGDLQDAVNHLTEDNEDLAAERDLLFASLHTQTKKLQNCRHQIEQLKCLLIGTNRPDRTEKEAQLEELLNSAQEEREELLYMQKELGNALYGAENDSREQQETIDSLKEKVQVLENKLRVSDSERQHLEQDLSTMRHSITAEQIELARCKTLLENEKMKVADLEQYRNARNSSDMDDLLHSVRLEKEKVDEKLANVEEALAHGQVEITRLTALLQRRDEEMKVNKSSAKTELDTSVHNVGVLEKEKEELQAEIVNLRDHVDQLDQDCDKYVVEKKSSEAKIQELNNMIALGKQAKDLLQEKVTSLESRHNEESEEWKQFQKDLQVAVVIANDFRNEKEVELDNLVQENMNLKAKCTELDPIPKVLNGQAHLLNKRLSPDMKAPRLSPTDKELTALRDGRRANTKNKTLSVKNLIHSIEAQVKCEDGPTSPGLEPLSEDQQRRASDPAADIIMESPTRLDSPDNPKSMSRRNTVPNEAPFRSVLKKTTPERHGNKMDSGKSSSPGSQEREITAVPAGIASLLSRSTAGSRRNSVVTNENERRDSNSVKDPLSILVNKPGGSKRNALLKWCKEKTVTYSNVDITNFSSSWNDGLAFCSLLHSYLPDKIQFDQLNSEEKRVNFMLAFEAAESVGIPTILDIDDMVAMERPDWQTVMSYIISIYKHFEVDNKS